MGEKSKIKGKIGSWMCFVDYDKNGDIRNILTAKIDGKKYKKDTWYWLLNGKIVEVDTKHPEYIEDTGL